MHTSISRSTTSSRGGVTLLTACAPAAWGTTYIVTTELLPAGHPLFAAFVRALPAGILALAFARALPRGWWWAKAAVLGILNIGIFFPLLFLTAERLPGGVAATLGATLPLLVAFLSAAILAERLSLQRLAWGVLGIVGVGLVVLGPAASLDGVGLAAGLAGTCSMALGVVLAKRWGSPPGVGPVAYAGWQLTAGGLVLAGPALLLKGVPVGVDAAAIGGYVWLAGLGGLAAYALWFHGLRSLSPSAASLLGLLSPMVAAILGAVVLDQGLQIIQLVGFALALAAMVGGQLPPRRVPRIARRGRRTLGRRTATLIDPPTPAKQAA